MREKGGRGVCATVTSGNLDISWSVNGSWDYLQLNTTTAPRCIMLTAAVAAAVFTAANYHPRKGGIHCSNITR